MYDPIVGRFITEDPIGFDGDKDNLYSYCGNSPTNATDPTGLFEESPGENVHESISETAAEAAGFRSHDAVDGDEPAGDNCRSSETHQFWRWPEKGDGMERRAGGAARHHGLAVRKGSN